MPVKYLSPDHAAEYLGISRRQLDRFLHTDDPLDFIPSARIGSRRRIDPADLDAWFTRHKEDA